MNKNDNLYKMSFAFNIDNPDINIEKFMSKVYNLIVDHSEMNGVEVKVTL